jgi:hypothetical protein
MKCGPKYLYEIFRTEVRSCSAPGKQRAKNRDAKEKSNFTSPTFHPPHKAKCQERMAWLMTSPMGAKRRLQDASNIPVCFQISPRDRFCLSSLGVLIGSQDASDTC